MDEPVWRDGTITDMGRDVLSVEDHETGMRHPIPPREREGLNVGDRVSYLLRTRRFRGRRWVDRILFRP